MLYKNIINHLSKQEKVLQIGCGAGNLARLMIYSSYNYVRGVDATQHVIDMAQKSIASIHRSKFMCGYFDDAEMYNCEYDTVVCTEVFEYSDCDIEVLASTKEGARVIFTVPGYPNERFPRWFKDEKEIQERYELLIDVKSTKELIFNNDFCKIFIVDSVRV